MKTGFHPARRRNLLALPALLFLAMQFFAGCVAPFRFETIDPRLALAAQTSLAPSELLAMQARERRPARSEEEEEAPSKSVIIGELLAIFPGLLVPGVGHYYAGDRQTAKKLFEMAEFGYLFTAIGGGVGVGAYYVDKSQDNFLPVGMYVAAGGMATIGAVYLVSAWICDIYDTPRAIRTGGKPWSFFQEDSGFGD